MPKNDTLNQMRKNIFRIILGVLLLICVVFGFLAFRKYYRDRSITFRAGDDMIQIYRNGEWRDFLIKGVNLGSGKPGSFPGEMGIEKVEYSRWLKQIAAMNANAIRIYTIHSPGFYQALFEHNMLSDKPIYLLQGIWIDDNNIEEFENAYAEKLFADFHQEIRRTIDVVHGNVVLKQEAGHASGTYRFNVSPYVLGYILAQEMDTIFVTNTNDENPHVKGFEGDYLYTKDASPFEAWLAMVGNYAISYEQDKYGGPQKPLSWTNWPTTDPLTHPNEQDAENEDAVSVDTEHIYVTDKYRAGIFASYHVYPYYPDFLRFEPRYTSYIDGKGKPNPYEAYLTDLRTYHTMPVLIAEFGVPSSRGQNHRNQVLPYNQGNHTEAEQGEAVADMFDSIVKSGYAGGLVFTWQDEWFKKAWNTMDMDVPERRPYWPNYQTSEQNFGFLAFEPGAKETISQVDGDFSEWEDQKSVCSSRELLLNVMSDEKYIYMMLRDLDMEGSVENRKYQIGLDIVPDLGSNLWAGKGIHFSREVDVIVEIDGKENSAVYIEASEDPFYYMYSIEHSYYPRNVRMEAKGSGFFNLFRLILSRAVYLPELEKWISVEHFDTGKLLHGNSDPDSPDFNNLADFYLSPNNHAVEIRLPWMLLNAADPSTKTFLGDLYVHKPYELNPVTIEGIYIEAQREGSTLSSIPGFYSWRAWGDTPTYHERLKKSYPIVKEKFAEY